MRRRTPGRPERDSSRWVNSVGRRSQRTRPLAPTLTAVHPASRRGVLRSIGDCRLRTPFSAPVTFLGDRPHSDELQFVGSYGWKRGRQSAALPPARPTAPLASPESACPACLHGAIALVEHLMGHGVVSLRGLRSEGVHMQATPDAIRPVSRSV